MINDMCLVPCVDPIEIENLVLDILGDEITKGKLRL